MSPGEAKYKRQLFRLERALENSSGGNLATLIKGQYARSFTCNIGKVYTNGICLLCSKSSKVMNCQIFKWEQEADHAVVAAGPDSGLAFCHTKQKLIECCTTKGKV
ncbi:hypothetical protein WN943_016888 [Citrus x changshan-huyou]